MRSFWLLMATMVLAGGAWLSLLSSLNVAVQTVVPSWVRARALSVYMLVFYAGLAGGSSGAEPEASAEVAGCRTATGRPRGRAGPRPAEPARTARSTGAAHGACHVERGMRW